MSERTTAASVLPYGGTSKALSVAEQHAIEARDALQELLGGLERIETEDQRSLVAEVRQRAALARKQWKDEMDPPIGRLSTALAELRSVFKRRLGPLDAIWRTAGALLAEHDKRLRDEAARLEAERRRRAREIEEELRLQQAVELEEAGQVEEAAELLETPVSVVVPKVAPPERDDISVVTRWTYHIKDLSQVKEEYLRPREPNLAAIRAAVNSHHEKAAEMVGGIIVEKVVEARDR